MAITAESDRDWRDLPPELLATILRSFRLADSIRFGAVCRSWRSVATGDLPAPQPPFLLLPGDSTGTSEFFQFFDLTYHKFHRIHRPQLRNRRCLGSSQGNLIYIDDRSELHVLDPIAGSHFDLPSITTFDDVGDPEFDEDGNIVGYFYHTVPHGRVPEVYPVAHFIDTYYTKVIICPKTSTIVAISREEEKIAVCLPGDRSWSTINTSDPIDELPIGGFKEIIFYNDVLYALTHRGGLLSFSFGDDLKVINYEVLSRAFGANGNCVHSYLVEADGELLLVWRFANYINASDADVIYAGLTSAGSIHWAIYVTFGFKVFRMNWGSMLWEEIKSLGEWVLFLGKNHSCSLSSRDFPELKANSIYFTDDDDTAIASSPLLKRDVGVFNLEDGSIGPCYPRDCDSRLNWPPPIWFTPKVKGMDNC